MTAFLSNSTAAAEVGTNILRGISDMISSIPQKESGKTELPGFGTSHHAICSSHKDHSDSPSPKYLLTLSQKLVWCEGEQLEVRGWDNHNTAPGWEHHTAAFAHLVTSSISKLERCILKNSELDQYKLGNLSSTVFFDQTWSGTKLRNLSIVSWTLCSSWIQ